MTGSNGPENQVDMKHIDMVVAQIQRPPALADSSFQLNLSLKNTIADLHLRSVLTDLIP